MLEIVCLIWLWRVNGKNAAANGQSPRKYRIMTLALWFGMEFTGCSRRGDPHGFVVPE